TVGGGRDRIGCIDRGTRAAASLLAAKEDLALRARAGGRCGARPGPWRGSGPVSGCGGSSTRRDAPEYARGMDRVDALDRPARLGVRLGPAADEGLAERNSQPDLEDSLPAQPGAARAAGGAEAHSRGGRLLPQLPLCHRHRPSPLGYSLRTSAGDPTAPAAWNLPGHAKAGALLTAHHRRNAGPGLHHSLRRVRRDDGARLRLHRAHLPLLLRHAWVARCGAHRQRHLLQRTVRKFAAGHRAPSRHLASAGRGFQQLGRRDGQDDRRPKHRGGWRSNRDPRAGGRDPQIRFLPEHRARRAGRSARLSAGLRAPRDGPPLTARSGSRQRQILRWKWRSSSPATWTSSIRTWAWRRWICSSATAPKSNFPKSRRAAASRWPTRVASRTPRRWRKNSSPCFRGTSTSYAPREAAPPWSATTIRPCFRRSPSWQRCAARSMSYASFCTTSFG